MDCIVRFSARRRGVRPFSFHHNAWGRVWFGFIWFGRPRFFWRLHAFCFSLALGFGVFLNRLMRLVLLW